jgi:hypothetical protein
LSPAPSLPAAGKPVTDAHSDADKVGSGIVALGFSLRDADGSADRPGSGGRARVRQ